MAASHPRAAMEVVPNARETMRFFLAHRPAILVMLGRSLMPGGSAGEQREIAKELMTRVMYSGSWESFRAEKGLTDAHLPDCLAWNYNRDGPGVRYEFRPWAFIAKVQACASDLGAAVPHALAFVSRFNRAFAPHKQHPERTLASYIMMDCESISREAKMWWVQAAGAGQVISLQHDGLVMARAANRSVASISRELPLTNSAPEIRER